MEIDSVLAEQLLTALQKEIADRSSEIIKKKVEEEVQKYIASDEFHALIDWAKRRAREKALMELESGRLESAHQEPVSPTLANTPASDLKGQTEEYSEEKLNYLLMQKKNAERLREIQARQEEVCPLEVYCNIISHFCQTSISKSNEPTKRFVVCF